MGCVGSCCSRGGGSGLSMGSVSVVVFVIGVGSGIVCVSFVSLWDSVLFDGALFVRLVWCCVVCCVGFSFLCWSLGGGMGLVLGSVSLLVSIWGVGVGFACVIGVARGGGPFFKEL